MSNENPIVLNAVTAKFEKEIDYKNELIIDKDTGYEVNRLHLTRQKK